MDQKTAEPSEEFSPAESTDPFFTPQAMLRSPFCEASFSVFSADVRGLAMPNRDYAASGFNALVNGTQYKILDGFSFGLLGADGFAKLEPKSVIVSPSSVSYRYAHAHLDGAQTRLEIAMSLLRDSLSLQLDIKASAGGNGLKAVVVRPHIVLDTLGRFENFRNAKMSVGRQTMSCIAPGAGFDLASVSPSAIISQLDYEQQWNYKLGWGERILNGEQIQPKRMDGCSRVMGQVELPLSAIGPGNSTSFRLIASAYAESGGMPIAHSPSENSQARFDRLSKLFSTAIVGSRLRWGAGASSRLLWRLYNLENAFDLHIGGVAAYDAGSMWFRQVWLRDMFETMYANFDFFFKSDHNRVKRSLLWAFSLRDFRGIIPTVVNPGGSRNYEGVDSTLLAFLCGLEYLSRAPDSSLESALSSCISQFYESAISHRHEVTLNNGLLACPANYSWIDSKVARDFSGRAVQVPNRVPAQWVEQMQPAEAETLCRSGYYLAEVNAQWIRALSLADKLGVRGVDRAGWLTKISLASYWEKFGKDGTLVDIAAKDGSQFAGSNPGFCSASVVAAALMSGHMSAQKKMQLLSSFEKYFVYSQGKLFGIPVRLGNRAVPFQDDSQYHGNVFWPRDAPYLYRFLKDCKKDVLAENLLETSLSCQFSQGAVGFCNELFALDRDGPVPVKNPAQLWSGFAGPYISFFGEASQVQDARKKPALNGNLIN